LTRDDPPGPAPLPFVVIAGPTASGKGAVAHEIALRVGGEIISMDSMKVYREMDVATAKPSAERRREVPYHLIDIVDPSVDFSVGDFLPLLEGTLRDIHARGRRAILSGGTPLYLKTYLEGFRAGPSADWGVRAELLEEARALGPEALHRRLADLDAEAARKIHPRDSRRIVRALEVARTTGRPISEEWRWGEETELKEGLRVWGLQWDRGELYRRIDRRVESMVSGGLFEEAERLRSRIPPLSRSASQSIGYKEIWGAQEENTGEGKGPGERTEGRTREELVAAIQRATRRFAKRQLTWLRKMPIRWIPVDAKTDPREVATMIVREEIPRGG